MKYSFDEQCFKLAEYFLTEGATEQVKKDLAQTIQDAVEGFLSLEEERPALQHSRE